jgi:hypothetical protein
MAHVNPSLRILPRAMFTPSPVKRSSDAPAGTTTAGNSFRATLTNPANTGNAAASNPPAVTLPVATPTSPAGGIGTMSPWPPLVITTTPTPSSVPMAPTAQSLFGNNPWIASPGGTGPGGGYNYNPSYFATPQTAAKVAQMLGGTVVAQNALTPGGPFVQNQPNQMVQLPNGRMVNAGLIADMYNHGYTQQTVDQMVSAEVSGSLMV